MKPRHESIDHHRNYLHYFHSYAVLDCIDLTKFSEFPPRVAIDSFSITSLLPSLEETKQVADNFGVLVERVLVEYLPHLSSLFDVCVKHIEHRYSAEMANESHVVSYALIHEPVIEVYCFM